MGEFTWDISHKPKDNIAHSVGEINPAAEKLTLDMKNFAEAGNSLAKIYARLDYLEPDKNHDFKIVTAASVLRDTYGRIDILVCSSGDKKLFADCADVISKFNKKMYGTGLKTYIGYPESEPAPKINADEVIGVSENQANQAREAAKEFENLDAGFKSSVALFTASDVSARPENINLNTVVILTD